MITVNEQKFQAKRNLSYLYSENVTSEMNVFAFHNVAD